MSTKVKCGRCRGKGYAGCPRGASGQKACPVCDGAGEGCRFCDGDGKVDCSICGGVGAIKCWWCNGSGVMPAAFDAEAADAALQAVLAQDAVRD